MIYPLAGLVLGALFGAWGARRRGGKRFDLLQWATTGAIMGGLVGLFVLILLVRIFRAGG